MLFTGFAVERRDLHLQRGNLLAFVVFLFLLCDHFLFLLLHALLEVVNLISFSTSHPKRGLYILSVVPDINDELSSLRDKPFLLVVTDFKGLEKPLVIFLKSLKVWNANDFF